MDQAASSAAAAQTLSVETRGQRALELFLHEKVSTSGRAIEQHLLKEHRLNMGGHWIRRTMRRLGWWVAGKSVTGTKFTSYDPRDLALAERVDPNGGPVFAEPGA